MLPAHSGFNFIVGQPNGEVSGCPCIEVDRQLYNVMAHAPINNCTAAALFAAYKPLDVVFIAQAVFSLITLIIFSFVIGRTTCRRRRMPYHQNLKVSEHSGLFGRIRTDGLWRLRAFRASGTVPTPRAKSLVQRSKYTTRVCSSA